MNNILIIGMILIAIVGIVAIICECIIRCKTTELELMRENSKNQINKREGD